MNRRTPTALYYGLLLLTLLISPAPAAEEETNEDRLLSDTRQLTFDGRRSGEGYFSADGSRMIFQSEREDGNPFYQIYLLDLETGDTRRVSPGTGKTTCAWIHPSGDKALFASTHEDPDAEAKQREEIEFRESGRERRYSWDYDKHYDIYEIDLQTEEMRNLTNAEGYDAEGSYSPDGERIIFASNRHAYTADLSDEDAERFEVDKSYLMDLYIMDADGSDVRRLTDEPGYDGGPFFSADGEKICWRRFSEDGATAEVWTMNADGTDQRPITDIGAMSWAPYFHPSGDYLIFTTNKHGFSNFELYLIDAQGEQDPVRVTHTDGFDGLPVFSPDGETLAWTSDERGADGQSQIFLARWDDAEARRLLGIEETSDEDGGETDAADADAPENPGTPAITAEDLKAHIAALASERMEGRLTGTEGERLATRYVADLFQHYGLEPAGEDGSYFQPFEFTAGVSLGDENTLTLRREDDSEQTYEIDEDWRPLAFSETGAFDAVPIVFAGYGIVAPPSDDSDPSGEFGGYDSYAHLDVQGKWVLALRHMPDAADEDERHTLRRYASLRRKAMAARDKGAAGLIVVSGPNSDVRHELVPLSFDASLAGTSIPTISVTDETAAAWLEAAGKNLGELHDQLDTGDLMMGFELEGLSLSAAIDIDEQRRIGRNVLARLNAGEEPGDAAVIVGAHIDHLGRGDHSGSLARGDEEDEIHYGADDNASGVAALLEVAQWLADMKQRGDLDMQRDVLFAAWSGEEMGLLGSSRFVEQFLGENNERNEPTLNAAAYLNMDMVGRYRENLTVHGVGSSSVWTGLIERANVPVGLSIAANDDSYLPTDSTPFYARGVPILSAFTGVHADYHTPRDTPDQINHEGAQRIARFIGLITRSLATDEQAPDYIARERPERGERRANLRAYLGTIPDYAQTDVQGLKLSGVAKGGPADEAGLRGGDIVTELAGQKIENIYDYTYAIEDLEIGEPVEVTVRRGDEQHTLTITPGSRD